MFLWTHLHKIVQKSNRQNHGNEFRSAVTDHYKCSYDLQRQEKQLISCIQYNAHWSYLTEEKYLNFDK